MTLETQALPYPVDPRILPQRGTDLKWLLARAPDPLEDPPSWAVGRLYFRLVERHIRGNAGKVLSLSPNAPIGDPLYAGTEFDALPVGQNVLITMTAENCMNRDMRRPLKRIKSHMQLLLTCQDQWYRFDMGVHAHYSLMGLHGFGVCIDGKARTPMARLEDYTGGGATITEINGQPTGCTP